jgi:hypothetical protein
MIDDSSINIFSNFNDVAVVDGHIRQDFLMLDDFRFYRSLMALTAVHRVVN